MVWEMSQSLLNYFSESMHPPTFGEVGITFFIICDGKCFIAGFLLLLNFHRTQFELAKHMIF